MRKENIMGKGPEDLSVLSSLSASTEHNKYMGKKLKDLTDQEWADREKFARDWSPEMLERKNQEIDKTIAQIVEATKKAIAEDNAFFEGKQKDVDKNIMVYNWLYEGGLEEVFKHKEYELTGGIISQASSEFSSDARKRFRDELKKIDIEVDA